MRLFIYSQGGWRFPVFGQADSQAGRFDSVEFSDDGWMVNWRRVEGYHPTFYPWDQSRPGEVRPKVESGEV